MTREEAIAQLKMDRDLCNFNPMTGKEEPMNEDCRKSAEALDMAIKALEQQPCEDTISRQAAIDTIMGQPPEPHYPSWYAAQIEKLPAAQPEITRCKDCEHWTNDDCPFAWGKVEDAFCSYAERRTDG